METGPPERECVEHALLSVPPSRVDDFESAFATARPLIESQPGFRWLRLLRVVEEAGSYVLLVGWDRLEDHTQGFRRSPEYEQWRELLHHFYDPFPRVSHAYDLTPGRNG